MADKPGPFRAPSVVYVWDLSSNLVRKIGIDDFSDPSLFHLDADRDVLVVFQVNWKKYPPEVQQTKWMWKTGELLEKKLFLLSLAGACVDDAICFSADGVLSSHSQSQDSSRVPRKGQWHQYGTSPHVRLRR